MADSNPHVISLLCQIVDAFQYPRGVIGVRKRIDGTAFFPGGFGLWKTAADKLPPMPIGGVMILGHDFHSEDGYEKSLRRNGENIEVNPTWLGLLKLLKSAEIDFRECFFTNFSPVSGRAATRWEISPVAAILSS